MVARPYYYLHTMFLCMSVIDGLAMTLIFVILCLLPYSTIVAWY